MKFRFVIFFILVISGNLSYGQTAEGLKDKIKNLLAEQNLSGAVWSIVDEDGEIYVDAHGYKNMETRELLSATDKVHVGSVSKTILAAGLLRMATLKLLDLDDPVKKYLPNIPIKNKWEFSNPITIRHLIDNTSGLTDAKLWHVFSTTATPETSLESVYIHNLDLLTVRIKPGTVYSYSNLGHSILGMVIEKITQERYESFLDKNLLRPLGMTNSTFEFISQIGNNADKQLAYGHFDDGNLVSAMPMYLRPAGQFTTTAGDLGLFLRFMMSDGTINGKHFISSEYLESVGKPKFTDAQKNGVKLGYALGAYSRDRYGVVGVAKNGNILGFSAMTYMFSNYKKAFFIAYNMDSETANYDLFNEALVKHLGIPPKDYTSKQENIEKEISNWKGYYVPVVTKVEPFGLIDHVFSHIKVKITENGALLMPFQGKSSVLIYQGDHLFSMKDRTTISHAIYRAADGKLRITNGIKTLQKVSGFKIISIAVSLFLGIFGLVYLFVAGFINLIKNIIQFLNHYLFWVFIAILTMILSFIFIANQSFMNLGDRTFGNTLLAVASTLIPLFSVVSLILIIKRQRKFVFKFSFWAIILVLQFSALLMMNSLMPVIMWK